ncbi:MAG TPA: flagellar M-ring protein FliF, partial [Firmicutes bacterium]|nr:flagellar M-ring protein FliF [Bacillota bacterium]
MVSWKSYSDRVLGLWRGLSRGTRLLLVMGFVAALLTAGLTTALSRPRFVPLFRDLQVQDAAAITQKLAEAKIPYRLADNGNTVLVPQERVYQTRLDLAGEGLPRQGVVGYEILDKPPLGATESDRRIAYLRALQGELARTVAGLEG